MLDTVFFYQGNASPGDFWKVKETRILFKFEIPELENSLVINDIDLFL